MAVLDGCEAKFRTPVPEDRVCPKCGKEVEVFTVQGKITEEVKCECGYVFEAQPVDSPKVEKSQD